MGLRQCDKCSEIVDEAKAFCPGCGNAFVEEEKREASKFEKLDPTVQFGQTMYNQLLEDMGLNISNAPDRVQKRVEVITPVATETSAAVKTKTSIPFEPDAKPPELTKKTTVATSNTKWYILIGIAVMFFLPVALASAILLVLDILTRLK